MQNGSRSKRQKARAQEESSQRVVAASSSAMVQAHEASCASSVLVVHGDPSEEEEEDEAKAIDSWTLFGLVGQLYDESERQPLCGEGIDTTGALVAMVRTSCTTKNITDFPEVLPHFV